MTDLLVIIKQKKKTIEFLQDIQEKIYELKVSEDAQRIFSYMIERQISDVREHIKVLEDAHDTEN